MQPLRQTVLAPPRTTLVVGVADLVVSNNSGADLITYSLGSCLGVAIYDPVAKIGGLLHLMLPDSAIHSTKASTMPLMFVDTGVPRLFHAAYGLGADRNRLVVKVAGGAQLLDQQGIFNIGSRNFAALEKLIAQNGLKIHASDIGGPASRTMRLDLTNGNVTIKTPSAESYLL